MIPEGTRGYKQPMRSRRLRNRLGVLALVAVVALLQARHLARDWATSEPADGLAKGEPVPHFVTLGADGGAIDLRQHLDDFVVVTFWASWCLPCLAELPELAGLVDEWEKLETRHHDLTIIAINVREDAEQAGLQIGDPRYRSFSFAFDNDGSLARMWRVQTLPSCFLIDPAGRLLESTTGYEPGVRLRLLALMASHDDPGSAP